MRNNFVSQPLPFWLYMFFIVLRQIQDTALKQLAKKQQLAWAVQQALWAIRSRGNHTFWDASCTVGLLKTKQLVPVQLDLPFVLEVPMCNLHPSMCDSVPCDRIVQRGYYHKIIYG